MSISEFTSVQLDTYNKIKVLEQELQDSFDPTEFTLNYQSVEIQNEIEALQKTCIHKWKDNQCEVCGKIRE